MLVLERKHRCGESIILHNRQTGEVLGEITVLFIRGGKVKLGIEAPAGVSVHRNEVFDRLTSDKLTNGNELAVSAGKEMT